MIIKIIVIVILLIAIIWLTWACLEPRCLQITHNRITSGKNCKLRIMYFSDLHAEFCFIPTNRVLSTIIDTKPDIVVFGGDICNNPLKADKGIKYLSTIAKSCESLGIPFIGTTGNHDVMIPSELVEKCGFTNISGTHLIVKDHNGNNIILTGLYDTGRFERIWQNVPDITNEVYTLHICLSHNPDQINHLEGETPDIMLSGHIHGGQIRTPFGLEFIIRKDELPKDKIYYGLHNINKTNLFISKGIGCIALPLRFGSRPEINILDIE